MAISKIKGSWVVQKKIKGVNFNAWYSAVKYGDKRAEKLACMTWKVISRYKPADNLQIKLIEFNRFRDKLKNKESKTVYDNNEDNRYIQIADKFADFMGLGCKVGASKPSSILEMCYKKLVKHESELRTCYFGLTKEDRSK